VGFSVVRDFTVSESDLDSSAFVYRSEFAVESGKYLFGTFWIPFLDISVCSPWASGVLPLVSLSF